MIKNSSSNTITESSSSSSSTNNAEIVSLHTQLQSLHELFEIQELALENNANNCTTLSHNYMLQKFSKNSSNSITKLEENSLETEKILSNFPYVRLLQCWRKQTLAKTIQNTFLNNELEKNKYILKEEQKKYKETLNQIDADRIKWRQKAQVLNENNQLLQQKLDQLLLHHQLTISKDDKNENIASSSSSSSSAVPATSTTSSASSTLTSIIKDENLLHQYLHKNQQEFVQILASSFQKLQQKYNQFNLVSNSKLVFCVEKLEKYEKKILNMTEQIELLSLLVHQKEIQERNSNATLELTKKLYETKFLTQLAIELSIILKKKNFLTSSSSSTSISSSFESFGGMLDDRLDYKLIESLVNENFNSYNTLPEFEKKKKTEKIKSVLLSDLNLLPEAEALLKSVFNAIDLNSTGVIHVINLLKSFIEFDDDSIHSLLPTSTSSTSALINSLTPLGSLLIKAIKSQQLTNFFTNLFNSYLSDKESTITWGELLLSLVIIKSDKKDNELLYFNFEDISKLCQNNLCESIDWGVIPLQLDSKVIETLISSSSSSSSSASASTSSTCPSTLEIQRLRAERSILMKKLSNQTRKQTYNVEQIKQFYEAEMKLIKLKLINSEEQKNDYKEKYNVIETKLNEMNEKYNDLLNKNSIEINNLNQKLKETESKLNQNRKYFQLLNYKLKNYSDKNKNNSEKIYNIDNNFDETNINDLDDASYNELKSIIDEELEVSHNKYVKLETDFLVLQRELAKKEVKCTALNRECQKFLTKHSLQQVELNKKDEELNEKNREIQSLKLELKELTEKLKNNNENSQQKINLLEDEVSLLKKEIELLKKSNELNNKDVIEGQKAENNNNNEPAIPPASPKQIPIDEDNINENQIPSPSFTSLPPSSFAYAPHPYYSVQPHLSTQFPQSNYYIPSQSLSNLQSISNSSLNAGLSHVPTTVPPSFQHNYPYQTSSYAPSSTSHYHQTYRAPTSSTSPPISSLSQSQTQPQSHNHRSENEIILDNLLKKMEQSLLGSNN